MIKRDNDLKIIANVLVYLLIISYVLPSGMIGTFHVQRWIIYILLLVCVVVAFYHEKLCDLFRQFKIEIVVIIAGICWCVGSYLKGEEYSLQFFGLLYITLFTFLGLVILLKYDMIDLNMVLKCMLIMLFGKILEKMIVEIMFVFQVIEYEQVAVVYESLFQADVTTMTMQLSHLELVRIQTSSDAIVFSLAPFLWFALDVKKKYRVALFVLTGIFAMIVFSRVYLVQYAFFAAIAVVYYGRNLGKGKKVLIGVGILISAIFWLKPGVELVKIRFFSSSVSESDSIRMEQMGRFLQEIPEHLWLGKGMGSYLPDYLRDVNNPFSYELEYLSYIYQLGVIGFIVIIGGIIYIYLRHIYIYLKNTGMWIRFISAMVLLWYLVRPLFNPSFLGKQNGFLVMGILLMDAYFWKNQIKEENC